MSEYGVEYHAVGCNASNVTPMAAWISLLRREAAALSTGEIPAWPASAFAEGARISWGANTFSTDPVLNPRVVVRVLTEYIGFVTTPV